MTPDVESAWISITTWLRDNAPTTAQAIRPPAPDEEIRRTQAEIGRNLPDDLVSWWRVMDGMDHWRAGFVVPAVFQPLGPARVRAEYASLSRYPDPECCRPGDVHRPAGEVGAGFCTAAVPICRDLGGDVLAIDLRPGDQRGRVVNFKTEQGFFPTGWNGVSAMLTDIAHRLQNAGREQSPMTAQPVAPDVVDDGVLVWKHSVG